MGCCILFDFLFLFIGKHVHSLAHATSGYHKVLEENSKLYNQVHDLKGKFLIGWLL
ncbi:hypothetical protein GLYMA_06G198401v4 [Glycine max]|nr:hypothetical protein GLYMA_06G198401v4 [Glycine max]KAH1126741.1 hypothetical protein GYH30_015657 [Glycine max]